MLFHILSLEEDNLASASRSLLFFFINFHKRKTFDQFHERTVFTIRYLNYNPSHSIQHIILPIQSYTSIIYNYYFQLKILNISFLLNLYEDNPEMTESCHSRRAALPKCRRFSALISTSSHHHITTSFHLNLKRPCITAGSRPLFLLWIVNSQPVSFIPVPF